MYNFRHALRPQQARFQAQFHSFVVVDHQSDAEDSLARVLDVSDQLLHSFSGVGVCEKASGDELQSLFELGEAELGRAPELPSNLLEFSHGDEVGEDLRELAELDEFAEGDATIFVREEFAEDFLET
eukprot:CAMPEP_0204902868 /NCGR_PEP_ID=MMETSP1397-20131031/3929_1 /ASSEMBLY_ACC=CAM_ASM_000891 /TAXON_ID=49980 /ORGANISM="Climacostomum Climacostomum virens, Strain Stock W-24" /LENGTH=126 /DNA_ID=CAMNT_0052071439 /DNA_START=597 /DNA_END=977 /DNA_ORIENTATION=-